MIEDELAAVRARWQYLKKRAGETLDQCQRCEAELSVAVASASKRVKKAAKSVVDARLEFTKVIVDVFDAYLESRTGSSKAVDEHSTDGYIANARKDVSHE